MAGDLYYGDNLDVLRRHVATESVDLVYLDPPFNSDRTYNVVHKGSDVAERAFVDSWRWDENAERAFRELTSAPAIGVPAALSAMMDSLGVFLHEHRDMLAYLSMMAIRLVELRRVLRKTGSIYVHCDPTASHYLKLILDAIFGPENFRREIIWRSGWVSGFKTRTANWVRNHDTLLYYLRDRRAAFTFNKELAYKAHERGYTRRGGGSNPRGVALDDVWDEVALYSPWIKSFSTEKLGYMTQKPLALLERIIGVSSKENDLVLDPFCGCGTTLEAAERLGRRWIGVDVALRAITVVKDRLREKLPDRSWTEHGEPIDAEQAAWLAQTNPFDFRWWAVRLLGGHAPKNLAGGASGGGAPEADARHGEVTLIDAWGARRSGILSVEGQRLVTARAVEAFAAVVERRGADFGVIVTLRPPAKRARDVARGYGVPAWAAGAEAGSSHRIRIVTVRDALTRRVEWPARLEGEGR